MPVDNGSFHLSPRAKSHILVCHLWSLTPEHQELMIKKQLDPFKNLCEVVFSGREGPWSFECTLHRSREVTH